MMKFVPGVGIAIPMLLLLISCTLSPTPEPTPTPQIFADMAFSGCAYLDENGNGELDPEDPGLEGLTFTVLGWSDRTAEDGCALVLIPGGVPDRLWPLVVRMKVPKAAPYEPIGPTEFTLTKDSGQRHFEFLFRKLGSGLGLRIVRPRLGAGTSNQ